MWLTKEEFCQLIPVWWKVAPCLSLQNRNCRKRVKEWCANNFYSIQLSKRNTTEEIHQLDLLEERQGLTAAQLQSRSCLKSELTRIIEDEELLWQARAKQHWLKEVDGNTKFFHAMTNGKARSNHIRVIEDDGVRLEGTRTCAITFTPNSRKGSARQAFLPLRAGIGATSSAIERSLPRKISRGRSQKIKLKGRCFSWTGIKRLDLTGSACSSSNGSGW